MAYMNQEKKKAIRVELKKVMPKDWKWSLSVKHHSTIVLTISQGPAELMIGDRDYHQLNPYYLESTYEDYPEIATIFKRIENALNLNNHDNSDIMTDYFDVGHYVNINLGKWNKPYQVI